MKAKAGNLKEMLNIMTPNWLRVDKAMIFFMSISVIAIAPAISIVVVAVRSRALLKASVL